MRQLPKLPILCIFIAASLAFSSCGTQNRTQSGWSYNESGRGGFEKKYSGDNLNDFRGNVQYDGMLNQDGQDTESSGSIRIATDSIGTTETKPIAAMLIYNASISLAVSEPDSTAKKFKSMAEQFGGYAQTIGTYRSVLRIPSDKLDAMLTALGSLGKVTNRSISANDVGEEYRDLQIRLDNAIKARQKYLDLLSKAATVEEMLKVEKELERLNGDIDLFKGRMTRINNLVQYCTIEVYLSEKVKPGPIGYVFYGLYEGVKWLFVRN